MHSIIYFDIKSILTFLSTPRALYNCGFPNDDGINNFFNEVQSLKGKSPNSSKDKGIETSFSDEQPLKANLLIFFTDDGIQ